MLFSHTSISQLSSVSLLAKAGYRLHTSSQLYEPWERATRTLSISSRGTLNCFMVNSSLKVTDFSSKVWKSIVIPKGIPISSVLAYLLPMDWPESSTLQEITFFLSLNPELYEVYWDRRWLGWSESRFAEEESTLWQGRFWAWGGGRF